MLTVNLEETKRRIREALDRETPESLAEWYNERRRSWQELESQDNNANEVHILKAVSDEFVPPKAPELYHDWLNTISTNSIVVSDSSRYSYLAAA
jgi:uncharacterized Zn finger protein